MGFNHSIKVPTQYKKAAAVLKTALEQKKSIRALAYEEKHANVSRMLAVLKHYADNRGAIDDAIDKTKILEENERLCPALCKVLVTELIFGRKQLNGESRPVQTVRSYEQRLLDALKGVETNSQSSSSKPSVNKPRYVRVNNNLLTLAEAMDMLAQENWRRKEFTNLESYSDFLTAIAELEEDEFLIDLHVENLLIFHAKQKHYWAHHQYVKDKKFMLQDKGTCLVAELLQPPPGAVVLDLCAAPGMKTIHVSNVMQNKGTIYAVEQNAERYRVLCNMTKEAGCEIVEPKNADALTITKEDCPEVEYVVVDPSCSGSGMLNRISIQSEEKDSARLNKLAGLQIKMLSHAMSSFPKVKRIAYSTCSLYEEENEQVVQRCLELNPQFKLLSGKKALRNKWLHFGNSEYKKVGKNCLYSRPEDFTDGIFVALFEKKGD